jgi:hypothetical protein
MALAGVQISAPVNEGIQRSGLVNGCPVQPSIKKSRPS